MKTQLFLILFLLGIASLGFAKEKKAASEIAASDAAMPVEKTAGQKVLFKKTERHEFSGTKLKGRLKKPELSYIYERKGLRQEQIVNVPSHFNDEIVKGAGQF